MYISISLMFLIGSICVAIGMIAGMVIGYYLRIDRDNYTPSNTDVDIDEHAEWWDGANYQENKPDMLKRQGN